MNWHPVLFNGEMVRAILEDRKTQTRRVITVPWHKGRRCLPYEPWYNWDMGNLTRQDEYGDYHDMAQFCPYGVPGDRLSVREMHYRRGRWIKNGFTKTGRQRWRFKAAKGREVRYADNPPARLGRKRGASRNEWWKRPSIFMPRWASRISLEVTGVRVERVQDISEEDALAEGDTYRNSPNVHQTHRVWFRNLWDSINAKRGYGWDTNPWCWVVEFKRIEG